MSLRTQNHRTLGSEPKKFEIQRKNGFFEDENQPVG